MSSSPSLSPLPAVGSFVSVGRSVGVVLGSTGLGGRRVLVEIVSRPSGSHHRKGDILVWQPADWPVPGSA